MAKRTRAGAFRPQKPSHRSPDKLPLHSLPPDGLAYAVLQASQAVQAVRQGRALPATLAKLQSRAATRWSDASRGAIRDLSAQTLRDYARGDALLKRLLRKPVPETLHCILLVSLARIERAPEAAYVTVHQTVLLVGLLYAPLKGLANAILRRVLRERDQLMSSLELAEESRYAYPQWWIDAVRADHPTRWQQILRLGNDKPPMSLRINRRRVTPQVALAALQEAAIDYRLLANGAVLIQNPVPVGSIPQFDAGWFSVQDAGAQYAAQWLDLADGQRVLDACSAPGNKSAHLLESADIDLLALEINAQRAGDIAPQLDRLGLTATIKVADASKPGQWWDGKPFDRILADVPCSASGVVRRHPDSKWLRRADDLPRFAAQQGAILRTLWHTLAPNGKLLYVTCSVFAQENRLQIQNFCQQHNDAQLLPLAQTDAGQIFPDADHDGFFYALLQKKHPAQPQ